MSAPVIWAVLVAGGQGQRFGVEQSKLLASLNNKPVIAHSFEALCQVPQLSGIVVVAASQWLEDYQRSLAASASRIKCLWALGGNSRRASVWSGLQQLPKDTNIVIVHDAARPLVTLEKIQAALAPVENGTALATSLGMPVYNTIKQVYEDKPWVRSTLERSTLWQTHTPQVFRKEIIWKAHEFAPPEIDFPDDASLVEHFQDAKKLVLMIEDAPYNLKVTTQTDLIVAEALLNLYLHT